MMKKLLFIMLVIIVISVLLTGCDKDIIWEQEELPKSYSWNLEISSGNDLTYMAGTEVISISQDGKSISKEKVDVQMSGIIAMEDGYIGRGDKQTIKKYSRDFEKEWEYIVEYLETKSNPLNLELEQIFEEDIKMIVPSSDGSYYASGIIEYCSSMRKLTNQDYFEGAKNFVLNISPDGDMLWSDVYYTGSSAESIIKSTKDGGCIVGYGVKTDISTSRVIKKLSKDGEEEWVKVSDCGDQVHVQFKSIEQIKTGDYIISGSTGYEGWVLCMRKNGDIIWEYEKENTFINDIALDGEYIIVVGTDYSKIEKKNTNFYLSALSKDGTMLWEKTINQKDFQYGLSLVVCNDGEYALLGENGYYSEVIKVQSPVDLIN